MYTNVSIIFTLRWFGKNSEFFHQPQKYFSEHFDVNLKTSLDFNFLQDFSRSACVKANK